MRKKSERGKLRGEIGKLHFEILKRKRGERCQISGKTSNGLGRFHILEVSTHPRLEFVDENVLLVNWLPYHHCWHHYGAHDKRNAFTLKRIIKMLGVDWQEKLLERERYVSRMDLLYLMALKETMKKELQCLKDGRNEMGRMADMHDQEKLKEAEFNCKDCDEHESMCPNCAIGKENIYNREEDK